MYHEPIQRSILHFLVVVGVGAEGALVVVVDGALVVEAREEDEEPAHGIVMTCPICLKIKEMRK